MTYWVEDGKPDPDVPFPETWEVCGYPAVNPLAITDADKVSGYTTLAMPMYHVIDPIQELQRICTFLESMPLGEMEKWLGLPDRQLSFGCGDPEMDGADMNDNGFSIPGPIVRRIRSLRLRLMIGFHPAANVRHEFSY